VIHPHRSPRPLAQPGCPRSLNLVARSLNLVASSKPAAFNLVCVLHSTWLRPPASWLRPPGAHPDLVSLRCGTSPPMRIAAGGGSMETDRRDEAYVNRGSFTDCGKLECVAQGVDAPGWEGHGMRGSLWLRRVCV
jgi:hypothetical protein